VLSEGEDRREPADRLGQRRRPLLGDEDLSLVGVEDDEELLGARLLVLAGRLRVALEGAVLVGLVRGQEEDVLFVLVEDFPAQPWLRVPVVLHERDDREGLAGVVSLQDLEHFERRPSRRVTESPGTDDQRGARRLLVESERLDRGPGAPACGAERDGEG
jgi:hypothetical protein